MGLCKTSRKADGQGEDNIWVQSDEERGDRLIGTVERVFFGSMQFSEFD